jgi:hypothetical protein
MIAEQIDWYYIRLDTPCGLSEKELGEKGIVQEAS